MSMKRAVAITMAAAAVLVATTVGSGPGSDGNPETITIRRHTLSGGLEVTVSPIPKAHTVSVAVAYRVGSGDEAPAAAGAAHLLEHMMFGGTTAFRRGVFASAVARAGGLTNAKTSFAHTVYFSTVPKADLPRLLEMEADRMTSLVFDAEAFAREKSIASDEYRLAVLNRPFGRSMEEAVRATAGNSESLAHLPVGTMATIHSLGLTSVRLLYEGYYAPDNCVIAVVGDIDERRLLQEIRLRFSGITRRRLARPSGVPSAAEKPSGHVTLTDSLAPGRRVDMLYRVPVAQVWQRAGLKRLTDVLAARISDAMYGPGVSRSAVSASMLDRRTHGLLWISASMPPDALPRLLDEAICGSLKDLSESGLNQEESERVRRAVADEMAGLVENGLARAIRIATEQIDHGDPGSVNAMAALRLNLPHLQWRELIAQIQAAKPTVIITDPTPRGQK